MRHFTLEDLSGNQSDSRVISISFLGTRVGGF